MFRLQRHSEFVKVLQSRKKVVSANIVIHYRSCVPGGESHLGLAVSKAVGGAVMRNTIKRRFRVLAREFEPALPPGVDIVMRALPSVKSASFLELSSEVRKGFFKISRILQSTPQSTQSMPAVQHVPDCRSLLGNSLGEQTLVEQETGNRA